jgi:hypothetical protein
MARGDDYLRELARKCLLLGLTEPEAIRYRQRILGDCLEQPAIVRQIYELAIEALESKRKAQLLWFRDSPDTLLHKSVRMLELLTDVLKRLRKLAEEHAGAFRSDGFARLFATLVRELDDDYLQTVDGQLRELQFRRGALISAELGPGNRGTHYVLRKPIEQTLLQKLTPTRPASYSFSVADRDEHGMTTLSELRGKGINLDLEKKPHFSPLVPKAPLLLVWATERPRKRPGQALLGRLAGTILPDRARFRRR